VPQLSHFEMNIYIIQIFCSSFILELVYYIDMLNIMGVGKGDNIWILFQTLMKYYISGYSYNQISIIIVGSLDLSPIFNEECT
jgi:hypothetical protein